MSLFRDSSIKRKLTLIMLATSCVALLLAGAGFLAYDLMNLRDEMQRELSTLAQVIGENSTAALTFNDRESAVATLGALRVTGNIEGACVYTPDGRPFAGFLRDPASGSAFLPPHAGSGYSFQDNRLILFHEIFLNEERVGTICLVSDLERMYSRAYRYGTIILVVMCISLLAALLLSARLQKVISEPILKLARLTRTVSTAKDYTVRAEAETRDEMGVLVDGFNEMLSEIRERDAALLSAQRDLERRVEERTLELRAEIVERGLAEERLRISELRFRSLVEQSPLSTQIFSPAGATVRVNAAWEKLWGVTIEDLADYNILHDPQLEARGIMPFIRSAFEGEAASIPPIPYRPDRGRYSDRELWTVAFIYPVKNHEGAIREVVLIHEDITDRIQAEQVIREQATLLDKAQDAIFVCDLQGALQFWNRSAERLYGWTAAEVLGRNASVLLSRNGSTGLEEARRAVAEREEWTGELRQVTKDGRDVTVESRWSLVRDNAGSPKSALVVNTDVTEKKQLESQFLRAQRMESIGTLAGGIAHDMNNVLAPVLMSVEILSRKFTDDYSRRILGMLESSAKRGSDLVKQVLTFARGVEGERTPLQMKHLVNDMEKIVRETFPRSISVRTSIPRDLWTINGDPTQLHQVLLNLCVNARDAIAGEGLITVTAENVQLDAASARVHLGAREGPYMLLTVTDTGSGIPKAIIDKIFDPFFTTKERGKGTGLGLSTLMAIVKSHGGFVTVYSEPDRGTSFRVYLPAVPSSEEQPVEAGTSSPLLGRGELVLMIDDEVSIQEITKETLRTYGYNVLVASHGNEALPLFFQHREEIDVVLTDMMMPYLDGPATIRALRQIRPEIRIIAASGFAGDERYSNRSTLDVQAFLSKPFTAEQLLRTLQEVLAQPEQRSAARN